LIGRWLRRPEVLVAAFTAGLQWLVLRRVLGPFIYADELGYVAAARFFGSGDASVQLQSGFFHAGYGLLLAPLTVVFDEPDGFHRAATTLNGMMLVAAAVLASRLVRHLYGLDPFQTVVSGLLFATSTSVMVSSGLLWAESTLTLLVVIMATAARRAATRGGVLDDVVLVVTAVVAYLVHPRGIAMTAAIVAALLLLAWNRQRWLPFFVAFGAIAAGFVATRALHDLTADQVFAGSALTGTNSSFRFRLEEYVLGAPGAWTRGLLGTAWYQLMASAGLMAVAWWEWLRSGADRFRTRGALDGRVMVGAVMAMSFAFSWTIGATIASGDVVRIDHSVYGRYLDHIAPLGFSVAGALVMTRFESAQRSLLAALVATPVLGWLVTLWWGIDFYGEPRQVAPINAPLHATVTRLLDNNLPGVIGVAAAVGVGVLILLSRRSPTVAMSASAFVLAVVGVFTVRNEVWPHSRDTVNLRAMADAVEEHAAGGTVLIAEPFSFLNLYGGQYWADDVDFVLGSECPAHPFDAVIAPIDDERYFDQRILFTDPRSERQLLEASGVGYPTEWDVSVSVESGVDTAVAGDLIEVSFTVTNNGSDRFVLPADGPRPAVAAYRFIPDGDEPYDTEPVAIAELATLELESGESRTVATEVALSGADGATLTPGRYQIVADLFVRRIGWVYEAGCPGGLPDGLAVEVQPAP
jgi:hypothetical protein